MWRKSGAILFVFVVFLVFLGVRLPAAWVHEQFAAGLPLTAIEGSIWEGRANLQYGKFPVQDVSWQLGFWPLLRGKAELDFRVSDKTGYATGKAVIGRNRITLHLPGAKLDAGHVNSLGLLPPGAAISGDVVATAIILEKDDSGFTRVGGEIKWSPAYLVKPQAISLQGYASSLRLDGNEVLIETRDLGGPLHVEGSMWVTAALAHRFSMRIRPREEVTPAIRSVLSQFGKMDSGGTLNLSGSGSLH